jgi:hypothetical protein
MIETAVLLAAIGLADVVRARVANRVASVVLGAFVAAAVIVAGTLLAGAAAWSALVIAPLVVLWLWAMTPAPGGDPHHIWPALVVLVAASLGAVTLPRGGAPHPSIAAWYAETAPGHAGIGWTTAVVALGVVLFLLRSTNLLVRGAISSRAAARASGPDAAAGDGLRSGAEGWRVRIGRRPVADVERVAAAGRAAPQLVGGRVIGPIERLLLIGLGLAGGAAVIAALVAAKGVVRFPEISADRGTGANAETFLVGSLTSWAVAAGGALLIWGTLG